jgi:hypothetical protein
MASPLSARTLEIAMFLMITFDISLTNLQHVGQMLGDKSLLSTGDLQANSIKFGTGILPNDTGIAANFDLVCCLSDGSIKEDNFLPGTRNCRGELGIGRDSGSSSTGAPGSSSILRCITLQTY